MNDHILNLLKVFISILFIIYNLVYIWGLICTTVKVDIITRATPSGVFAELSGVSVG